MSKKRARLRGLLTSAEAAKLLKITRPTLFRWVEDGLIASAFKEGVQMYFAPNEVEKIRLRLSEMPQPSREEVRSNA